MSAATIVWCWEHDCFHDTTPRYHAILWPRVDGNDNARRPGFASIGDFVSADCSSSAWLAVEPPNSSIDEFRSAVRAGPRVVVVDG